MNNLEILIVGITIITGLLVIYFSISTMIETRRIAIEQYKQNLKERKNKFNEKD